MKPVDRVLLRILPFSFSVLLFYSCAPAPVKPPSPPYSPSQVRQIVSEMRNEAMRITAFFSSGKLTFEEGRSQSVAQVLVVGTWQPFKVKIEATHSWGRPLVHIVIHGTKIHVLSFPEKRIYWGQLGSSVLTRFLPGGLDRDQIWSFVRGYPMLVDHAYAVSHQANRIRLLDGGGNALEQIEFYPESHLPRLVSFPPRGVNLFFFDYQTEKGIPYARKARLEGSRNQTAAVLSIKKMVFNQAFPDAVFEFQIPAGFTIVPLDSAGKI